MLEDSTKALASQPRWHGETDGSSPLNLAQAYHLILMVDLANGRLAFKVHGQWSRYRVLPFGLKCSPWIFPKLTQLLLWHWRSLGGMVAAYQPVGRTMTKASLVGTLGTLMGVAPLIQNLREAYWAAQMESSSAAHPGGGEQLSSDWKPYQNAIYGVPLWMPVKVVLKTNANDWGAYSQ